MLKIKRFMILSPNLGKTLNTNNKVKQIKLIKLNLNKYFPKKLRNKQSQKRKFNNYNNYKNN